MGIEYYVGFTDVTDEEGSKIPELIEYLETHLFGHEEFLEKFGKGNKLEFVKEELPYIGQVYVFKTDRKDIAQAFHEDMKELFQEIDAYVFPVKSSKK